jgi:hypothetical protein
MKRLSKLSIASFALGALLFQGAALAFQGKDTPSKATKTAATSAPSDSDIADAKGKGLVWVNTSTKVYHKDGEFYGKTKHGKFMAEADAQKAGYRAAKESPVGKKKAADNKK